MRGLLIALCIAIPSLAVLFTVFVMGVKAIAEALNQMYERK